MTIQTLLHLADLLMLINLALSLTALILILLPVLKNKFQSKKDIKIKLLK